MGVLRAHNVLYRANIRNLSYLNGNVHAKMKTFRTLGKLYAGSKTFHAVAKNLLAILSKYFLLEKFHTQQKNFLG